MPVFIDKPPKELLVALFGANKIDDYMKIKEQYPMVRSIASMLVLFVFSLSRRFTETRLGPEMHARGKLRLPRTRKILQFEVTGKHFV